MKNKVFVFSTIVVVISSLNLFPGEPGFGVSKIHSIRYSKPADKQANPRVEALLHYLTALSRDDIKGVVSGQNCYHGDQISPGHKIDGFNRMVRDLYKKSGKWVAMIGLDYEHDQLFSRKELSRANRVLIKYWRAGGLITINWAPVNPWFIRDTGKSHKLPSWNGPGSTRELRKVNLGQLIDPASGVHKNWMRMLDRIADALHELQKAGVVVLWRPMQEMNGSWFWWGMRSHPSDPKPYINVWRHMFNYFTKKRKLHNLLWVYSPNLDGHINSTWNRPVDWAYPGDKYVDIVSGTAYTKDMTFPDYHKYLSFRKPMGIAEFGPEGEAAKRGTVDTRIYAKNLKNKYPAVAYWVSWHSWPSDHWSLISNMYYKELMNDPYVITRKTLTWKKYIKK